uniref:Uncharacterized protein n=1 Tax=Parascaris univalens TaxID=6257 RepID=A0A915A501_PARUN
SLYNERYPCASQRVASTKNRKGLLVVHVVRKDTLKPYIGKATMLADGGQAAFKVLLKYIEKPNGSDSHVLFIAAMAVGFFCISAIAVTAHIILNRVSLSQEKVKFQLFNKTGGASLFGEESGLSNHLEGSSMWLIVVIRSEQPGN